MVLHRKYYGTLLSLTDSIDKDVNKCREETLETNLIYLLKTL
jgi:hypothetical protein